MELFLISNFIITLAAVLHNRYSHASIMAKLTLSTFSLTCWVLPFTLIRDLLPQEVAVNVFWLVQPITSLSAPDTLTTKTTLLSLVNLSNIFAMVTLIGACLFVLRIYQHNKWVNQLKNNPHSNFIKNYNKIPVYSSKQIQNALLIGYFKPSIWINPELIKSTAFDIILKHEQTHYQHKDNYWLLLIELVKAIYWWNPLLGKLVSNIEELLESRCDYKSSQAFTEGIYYQKLTDLILKNLPVANTGFVSAVISKNSNIRRLRSLKEKQTMNLFSKIGVTIALSFAVVILTFPISSMNVLAFNEKQSENKNDAGFSLNFEKIPVIALAQTIAEYLELEPVVEDKIHSEIVSIIMFSVPDDKIFDSLKEKLNLSFIQKGNQLIVSSLPGEIIRNREKYDNKGIMIEFVVNKTSKNGEVTDTNTALFSVWTAFAKNAAIQVGEDWKMEFMVSNKNDELLFDIQSLNLDGKEISQDFNSRLVLNDSSGGSVEWVNSIGENYQISLIPHYVNQPTN